MNPSLIYPAHKLAVKQTGSQTVVKTNSCCHQWRR